MNYEALSDNSRVWIYQSETPFTPEQSQAILQAGQQFISGWNAHGAQLVADFQVLHNQFIIFVVDENVAATTGCSIDKSVQFVKEVEKAYGHSMFNRMKVAIDRGNGIELIDYNAIAATYESGEIADDTLIFNNLVDTKKAFDTGWKLPFAQSWYFTNLIGTRVSG